MQTLLYQQAHTLFQRGLDLLFPPRCAGCQQSGSLLCPACLRSMQPLATPCCQRCGAPLAQSADHCASCQWQAILLARVCATHLKVPCLEGGVIRQHATRAQVGLSTRERQQNVLGAFALTSDAQARLFAYQRGVLIDDVATTGATLEACAVPLCAAGMHEVWGLVLARPVNLIQDTTQGVL
jgi:predicted amidophosphoribosyltransferase